MLRFLLYSHWKKLPQGLRRRALFAVASRIAPRPRLSDPPAANPIVVAGFLGTASGMGESARLCYDALTALGYDTRGVDLSGGILRQDLNLPEYRFRCGRSAGDTGTMILHVNPPVISLALLSLGRALVVRKRLIAYWAWELPDIPADWLPCFRFVHEIWVPSNFTAEALSRVTDLPILVVPHPVRLPDLDRNVPKPLGLPAGVFVVLTMFNMSSGFTRKNPVAAVKAFRRAFGSDSTCMLVIKTSESDRYPQGMAELRAAIGQSTNIRIIDEALPMAQRWALIQRADVVLSLHRAEGFGLVLAEAMLMGKPVVATGWSGNMDFMNPHNSVPVPWEPVPCLDPQFTYHAPHLYWAEPSVDAAAEALQNLRTDSHYYRTIAQAALANSRAAFGLERYKEIIAPRLPSLEIALPMDTDAVSK